MSGFTGLEKEKEEFKQEYIEEGCIEQDPLPAVFVEDSLAKEEDVKKESDEKDPLTIQNGK